VSTRAFFDPAAKASVRKAIERVEGQTSAELVVAVRRQAGISYRETDYGFGAVVALASLAIILFVDREFATLLIPVDVALSFALGAIVCRYVDTLRRVLTPGSRRQTETHRAACAAFHEMGVGRTSGRNGILVLVGLFEHKAAVVADVGVDPHLIKPAIEAIQAAVGRVSPDFTAFVAGLDKLGPILASTMPRQADDVNELPDEMGVE
jgi:putative membrane protein